MAEDYTRDLDFPEEVVVGDTLSVKFKLIDEDGAAYDLAGATIYLTIKEKFTDLDANAIVQGSTTSHYDEAGGLSSLKMVIPATAKLGNKYFDAQVTDISGDKYTFKRGRLELVYEVTKT